MAAKLIVKSFANPYDASNYWNNQNVTNHSTAAITTVHSSGVAEIDTITINAAGIGGVFNALIGGAHTQTYTAVDGDTVNTVAAKLAAKLLADTNWTSAATITVSNNVITITAIATNTALVITTTNAQPTLVLLGLQNAILPKSNSQNGSSFVNEWYVTFTQA